MKDKNVQAKAYKGEEGMQLLASKIKVWWQESRVKSKNRFLLIDFYIKCIIHQKDIAIIIII